MKVHWLYASVLSTLASFILTAPAEATRLENWRFESRSNRLVFTTDEGVQPRAQFIQNPARIVIDLPGTSLGNALRSQLVGGAIREVRVGQFDSETTRIVIELAPGYTVDPQQILVRGASPNRWSVQLPTPERLDVAERPPAQPPAQVPNGTLLEGVQVTPDGLFLRTSGAAPEIDVRRDRGRNPRVTFELEDTVLSPQLPQQEFNINRFGIRRLRLSQDGRRSPTTRVTLELTGRDLAESDFNWRALPSEFGGIVLLPPGGNIARPPSRPQPPVTPPGPGNPTDELANLTGIELSEGDRQLVIRTDRPVRFSSGWDRTSNAYRITLEGVRMPSQLQGPRLTRRSLLRSVTLRWEDDRTVVLLVQPANGVRVGDLTQPGDAVLALGLQGIARPGGQPDAPIDDLPQVGRTVVVIDPGHGGIDPGAIGIGGLREVDIVDDVVRHLTEILEQQGVQVVLTRNGSRTVELEPRVQIAERAGADYFVSIHANAISMSRPDVNGVETFYSSEVGRQFATAIQNSILESMDMNDRGVKQARFYVIRNTSMPAVLVETGFVTGAQDAPRLATPEFRRRMAEAIARGILRFIQQRQ